jgi:IclR family transcriptional regulator, pca regulon regulatory protein
MPRIARTNVSASEGDSARPSFKYVQSLERGLAIIACFDEANPQLTLADVARATNLDRSTARRFLLTLESLGYVEQRGRYFRLTARTLRLGYGYLSSLPWWRAAQNISESLTARIQISSAVGVLDQQNIVYVAYASAGRFPSLMTRSVGTHLPAVATAIGRVLLAALDPKELHKRLGGMKLEKYTSRTPASRAELENLLNQTRDQGFSLVDQELEIGLRALGVPIRNRAGDVVAGMSVSLVEAPMTSEVIIERYLAPLQSAAKEVTESLPA